MSDVPNIGPSLNGLAKPPVELSPTLPIGPNEKSPALESAQALRKGAALHKAGKFKEAEALLRNAIASDRGNSVLWNARGVMMAAMRRYIDAMWCYREALALNSNNVGAWTNLGNAYTQLKQIKCAIDCHKRAISLKAKPDALLYHNLGASLVEAGLHDTATVAFTHALKVNPDHHPARWDRAHSYLYLGKYREGWSDYEVRLVSGQVPKRAVPGEKWDGRQYASKRLVVVSEQGFGDMLWVARYFPQVKALGGELIIECRRELKPLIESMNIADQVIARGEPLPKADLHCYMCSLPGLFTPNIAAIRSSPYLAAPTDRLAKFQPLIEPAQGRLRVGIVWSGSVTFKKNHERAQTLMSFIRAFAIPGVQLYSLQKGVPEKEVAALPKGYPLVDLSPHISDFADTAAAIEQLDHIIMTDSAVAHLAGAMGKPVWVLLSKPAHWLWLNERADSPWYPTVRLFRPRASDDWAHVFDAAAADLIQLSTQKSRR